MTIAVILFVLGSIVGSFLNVVGLRWGTRQTLLGRSHCPSCSRTLKWWELVPIISFLALRARCRECRAKISWTYPLVELWTGLIFVTVPYIFIPVFCIYVVILIYDFHHKIIPDELVYASIFLSFLVPLFFIHYSVLDWLAGPIIFTFFGSIWLLSGGRAMGFGDAKLGLSLGLLLGAPHAFSAVILAFWVGASVSLIYIFLNKTGFLKDAKELTMKSEVPFAPAIILGAWISLVFRLNILHVTSF
ncbi:MAG: prepilin peptidase [bacterium]|nr:prepilin peptidase [bacterium]